MATYEQWYENPALVSYYREEHRALLNRMEARITLLYQLLDKMIMPWQWDYDNYTGNNSDMIGFFYPEDLAAITQIRQLEAQGENARAKRMKK
jgi:hypothetical protein